MIQIDTAPHHFVYTPDRKLLNKFDVFTAVSVTPAPLLLSQKIRAALQRKRSKGRDFYDIVFLLAFVRPEYTYLQEKMRIPDAEHLRKQLLDAVAVNDMKALARDVQPFLFDASDSKKVELFAEFIRNVAL